MTFWYFIIIVTRRRRKSYYTLYVSSEVEDFFKASDKDFFWVICPSEKIIKWQKQQLSQYFLSFNAVNGYSFSLQQSLQQGINLPDFPIKVICLPYYGRQMCPNMLVKVHLCYLCYAIILLSQSVDLTLKFELVGSKPYEFEFEQASSVQRLRFQSVFRHLGGEHNTLRRVWLRKCVCHAAEIFKSFCKLMWEGLGGRLPC